jgi:hypothetical protein
VRCVMSQKGADLTYYYTVRSYLSAVLQTVGLAEFCESAKAMLCRFQSSGKQLLVDWLEVTSRSEERTDLLCYMSNSTKQLICL